MDVYDMQHTIESLRQSQTLVMDTHSPGNEMTVDHWKWTKMLTNVFKRNLTQWGYVNLPINPTRVHL